MFRCSIRLTIISCKMGGMHDNPFRRTDRMFVGDIEVGFMHADRSPCPVCGHPTGDCAGESGPPKNIAAYNTIEQLVSEQTYLVEEDIFEERQITPFTKARVLKYPKGKQIPLEEARNLGLA